jgi:prepilin peptidase CpaA
MTISIKMVVFIFLFALVTDCRDRRIPNLLTLPAVLAGLMFHAGTGGPVGALWALKGALFGGVLLIIPFALGGMGGGDVKLLAAAGAWLGLQGVGHLFIYGALVGAMISIGLMARRRDFKRMGKIKIDIVNLMLTGESADVPSRRHGFAYSIPMAAGLGLFILHGPVI